ncbi:MAG: hypothetical protein GY830_08425 [Bacteroidetes bacterium]|nr:hypothetical protein [Bacteroidota bacterium]
MKIFILYFKTICIFLLVTCKYNKNNINMKSIKNKYKLDYYITDSYFLDNEWEDFKYSFNNNKIFEVDGKFYKWKYKFCWFPCTIARRHLKDNIYREPLINGKENYIYNINNGKYLMEVKFY